MRNIVRVLAPTMLLFLLLVWGTPVYGHERWFVQHGGHHVGESQWIDWLNVLLIGVGVLLVAVVVKIDRSRWYGKIEGLLEKWRKVFPKGIEWRCVAVLTAAMLISNVIMGVFLAPDLQLPGLNINIGDYSYLQVPRAFLAGDSPIHMSPALLGAIAQLLLALILLSQVSFLIPGVLIIIVALPMAVAYFEPDYLIDYAVELLALGIAFIFAGMAITPLDRRISARLKLDPDRFASLALPVIRTGLGLTLIIIALHNKLLNPNMALSFLDKHYFNFMPVLGFTDFSNIRFVFAAGVIEAAVGFLFVFGIATRFVAALAFLLMTITMAILGPVELSGHLPVMGIEILLIYRGSDGFVLVPRAIKQQVPWQTSPAVKPVVESE